MSPAGPEVDHGVLDGIASTLRNASLSVDEIGNSVPTTPDAGDGTPAIAGIMARLIDNAGQLVVGAAAAGDAVAQANAAYQETDSAAANGVNNVPGAS